MKPTNRIGTSHTGIQGVFVITTVFLVSVVVFSLSAAQSPNEVAPATMPATSRESFRFVDSKGESIDAGLVPPDLVDGIHALLEARGAKELIEDPYRLVLAKMALPADERDRVFASSLVSEDGYGGMHYLTRGGQLLRSRASIDDAICIRAWRETGPFTLDIAKLGYTTIRLPLPAVKSGGNVVWMGEVKLERSAPSTMRNVEGLVTDSNGQPLIAKGTVSLRVNGTPGTLKTELKDGKFAFSDITPGGYLIDFNIPGFTAETWWATVDETAGPVRSTIVARPR